MYVCMCVCMYVCVYVCMCVCVCVCMYVCMYVCTSNTAHKTLRLQRTKVCTHVAVSAYAHRYIMNRQDLSIYARVTTILVRRAVPTAATHRTCRCGPHYSGAQLNVYNHMENPTLSITVHDTHSRGLTIEQYTGSGSIVCVTYS